MDKFIDLIRETGARTIMLHCLTFLIALTGLYAFIVGKTDWVDTTLIIGFGMTISGLNMASAERSQEVKCKVDAVNQKVEQVGVKADIANIKAEQAVEATQEQS